MNLTVGELSVPVIRAFAGEKECKGMRRGRALRRFDKELAKGNYKAAHSLLKQLQYKTGGLLGFGSAKLVPKRLPAMNRQELCMVDESLVDSVLCSIKYSIEFALSDEEVLLTGMEDDLGSESDDSPYEDHQMCLQVDMSTISSKSFTQGKENRAKISSQTLNRFLCVILGGLAAEHLIFGYSELLHSDVQKLDRVLSWLCLNENEGNSLVRRAVLTTLSLLSHHHEARSRLAEAMASRRSIGYCIDMIESTL
ncbi:uncharacterized protein LOC132054778 isoform X4 [Lycium ferocissimum]|uniref:uncharacterized protein LOC132054778 isoform X4 n=1 Tax=Lycium ferocissimum TaxID=112874 RepID=UPI0028158274|nr:uncharacterized protein LOC132054778 isoform X4 [Lycium ferocissimum]